ncbi:MAG: lipoprotein insertase outer membrane protein LolB [Gammaproteobacteria bacterium]|nr:lipoprotein insertase outer membrane protein LolB [Gammaproteobacteria bacterium]
MIRRFLLAALLATGASGCVLKPPLPVESDWNARQESLGQQRQWNLSGRLSVRTSADAVNGSLTWLQHGQQLELGFRGPLGMGGFRLTGDDRQMLFEDSKGQQFVLDDPANALASQAGWDVPLTSLGYWVRALPDPAMQVEQSFGPSGRLSQLHQDGWSVTYEEYALEGAFAMPGRVTVERDDVRIRLVVDNWRLGSTH